MSALSPITETTLFLFSAITSTTCKIDFVAVGAALDLQPGTASMRYRRLSDRINKSTAIQSSPAKGSVVDENTLFLYNCMVASKCKPDWNVVGVTTGLRAGTASMRWRRLQEKIEKEHGSSSGIRGNPVDSNAAKAAVKAKSAKPASKLTTPKKRKAKGEPDSESEDEVEHKRMKAEEATPAEKRQTRGKKLDYKAVLDSSSSGVSTSYTGTGTSVYKEGSVREEADESLSEDEPEERTQKGPGAGKVKATNIDGLVSPAKSGSHSFYDQLKPIASSIASSITPSFSNIDPIPQPLSPVSAVIVQSVEVNEDNEAKSELNSLRNGRFIPIKRSIQSVLKSRQSSEMYDADSERAPASDASSLQALASSASDFLDAADMESVAPDDSISQGGIKREGVARNKSMDVYEGGILTKLLGFFN